MSFVLSAVRACVIKAKLPVIRTRDERVLEGMCYCKNHVDAILKLF